MISPWKSSRNKWFMFLDGIRQGNVQWSSVPLDVSGRWKAAYSGDWDKLPFCLSVFHHLFIHQSIIEVKACKGCCGSIEKRAVWSGGQAEGVEESLERVS